ncbi:class III extradiol dioxygenase subunit B-like domain-containing protein [Streptomyces sp. CC210A]|uniref:class III extradiol dioxygenase subunit B-like domain-containing protein n=1 Tax=Streptomyces sp. CC210A TaxID=2898184 RepID=UPI001F393447|nr:class III extradiol dioxygenase subunit B-like domain-containing protein [Streptomyces sp. CC210A]
MLVAAAVCPCPPLLVPEVAAGAASELDAARAACLDALGVLAASRPDRLVVVGTDPRAATSEAAGGAVSYPEGASGGFQGFGVDLDVMLGPGGTAVEPAGPASGPVVGPPLPDSLAVGAWLLGRADWSDAPVEGLGVDERLAPGRCTARGREIADRAPRVALLVMGDGSACRTVKAPGYLDERAGGFDADAARALAAADTAALAALDPALAHELKAAGRAPWQVLAGAAREAGLAGRLLYDDAPYGVGYLVAAWS